MILAQNGIKKSYKLTCKFAYRVDPSVKYSQNITRGSLKTALSRKIRPCIY